MQKTVDKDKSIRIQLTVEEAMWVHACILDVLMVTPPERNTVVFKALDSSARILQRKLQSEYEKQATENANAAK